MSITASQCELSSWNSRRVRTDLSRPSVPPASQPTQIGPLLPISDHFGVVIFDRQLIHANESRGHLRCPGRPGLSINFHPLTSTALGVAQIPDRDASPSHGRCNSTRRIVVERWCCCILHPEHTAVCSMDYGDQSDAEIARDPWSRQQARILGGRIKRKVSGYASSFPVTCHMLPGSAHISDTI